MKKISTTQGQASVATSPHWKSRVKEIPRKIERLKKILKEKNFEEFGRLIEDDCLDMHNVMQTQVPPIFYWNKVTKKIMEAVIYWRKNGLPVYFTIDAGPNVHLICQGRDADKVIRKIEVFPGVQRIISNKPSVGSRLTSDHLF
jgi:diphosphomevalonate decarboxylase